MARRPALYLTDTPARGMVGTGTWVSSCGHHEFAASYTFAAAETGLARYVLIVTLAGDGWLRLGRRTATVRAGEAFLVPPGREYAYGTGGSGVWEVLWMVLNGPTVAPLLTFWPGFPAEPCVRLAQSVEMTRVLTGVLREMAERRDGYSLLAAGYAEQALRLLIVDARRGRGRHAPRPVQALAQTVEAYVQAHLDAPLSLAEMAAQAHVSPSYLCKAFKRATGFSPLEYSIKQRLNRAKELLHTTALPVAAIARRVGYDDAAYFARVFRATTGLSPRAFRRLESAASGDGPAGP